MLGSEVIYIVGDGIGINIILRERYSCPKYTANNTHYVHKLVIDQDFIITKWGTR